MPEGDTLYRTAAGLRPHLLGRPVIAASARQPGPRAEMLVGATVTLVESRGKHLLIGFDSGLELRTHLGMHGSWHRYAPGERWHGPPSRAPLTIAEALLDQRALAGIGNVYKSEVLFVERVDPFACVADLNDETVRRLVMTSRRLLLVNREDGARVTTDPNVAGRGGPGRLWVYGRAGRPCRHCGQVVLARQHGRLNRRTYWCPVCQPAVGETPAPSVKRPGPGRP